jgi:hypothetical protein
VEKIAKYRSNRPKEDPSTVESAFRNTGAPGSNLFTFSAHPVFLLILVLYYQFLFSSRADAFDRITASDLTYQSNTRTYPPMLILKRGMKQFAPGPGI